MVVDGAVPPQLAEILITTMLRNAYCYPALLPGTGEERMAEDAQPQQRLKLI